MFVVLRGAHKCLRGRHGCFLQCVRCGSHYETLGVGKNASQEEIRTAFLDLSKQLHPDTNTGDPGNHEKFVKLNEAYTVLSKVTSRREYDLELDLGFKRYQTPGGSDRPPTYSETQGSYYYHPDADQRFEKEREYWRQYSASYGTRTEPRTSDGFLRSRGGALVLCGVLYIIGSLMGFYIYYRSRKGTEEIRKQSLQYAMEVRAKRRSGKHVGEFDEKFEKMFEKDLDAKEKQQTATAGR